MNFKSTRSISVTVLLQLISQYCLINCLTHNVFHGCYVALITTLRVLLLNFITTLRVLLLNSITTLRVLLLNFITTLRVLLLNFITTLRVLLLNLIIA